MVRMNICGGPRALSVLVDVRRTPWLDRFFSLVRGQEPEDILRSAAALDVGPYSASSMNDLSRNLSGWAYWALYLKGYVQYCVDGRVVACNVYLRYLTTEFAARQHDRGLSAVLSDEHKSAQRVTFRYEDADRFRYSAASGHTPLHGVRPALLSVCEHTVRGAKLLYPPDSQVPFPPVKVDGYHRLFLARLFRVYAFECQLVE
jgi:hypothetical protein